MYFYTHIVMVSLGGKINDPKRDVLTAWWVHTAWYNIPYAVRRKKPLNLSQINSVKGGFVSYT